MNRTLFRNAIALALVFFAAGAVHAAEGPPTSNGIISNPTLVANQDVAKAQAVGAITTFISQVRRSVTRTERTAIARSARTTRRTTAACRRRARS
ncbi:TPA: hypothetical protein QDB04_000244 [Burkholderia vietnamiensis]|nr:hypothetical protein [Burkholderia vietnamiensis]